MNYAFCLSMLFGGLGVLTNALIYQQKSGKKLLVYKLISDVFWAAQYFFVGGYSGMAISLIGIVRESIFLNQGKRWADTKLWLLLFASLAMLSAALTWSSVLSILPTIASLLSVFGFWRANPKLSRLLAYPISACMLTYDIFFNSYMGIANEILTLVSTTIAVCLMFSASRNTATVAEVEKLAGGDGSGRIQR